MRTVVSTAVEQARPLVQSRGHELRTRVGAGACVIQGDYHRLVQIVVNLLNNAAKYTPQGGLIKVGLDAMDGRAPEAGSSRRSCGASFSRTKESRRSRLLPRRTKPCDS